MMKRKRLKFLKDWLETKNRKPLVIRGARQVGKTWLVRYFAQSCERELIELNFEKRPEWAKLFESNDVQQILTNLSAVFGKEINPQHSLLFLDEIQATPEMLAKLRWFAEDLPDLPVIAAGSLLEFVLEKHSFSMPVGRISYLYLEPMSFEEFLLAQKRTQLIEYLESYHLQQIPSPIHEQLMSLFKEFMIVGGMPAAVSTWVNERSPVNLNQVHHDLLATYRDDFAKYRGRIDVERLEEVMTFTPKILGQKFIYSHVNPSVNTTSIKNALSLLIQAKVCHRITSTSANGIPLEAEANQKHFKVGFLDTGLCSAALGLTLQQLESIAEISLINRGGIADQIVSQLLRVFFPPYVDVKLHYWHREAKGSNAEIDFVIPHENHLIPVEVKAGSTGSMKSLHLFMGQKKLPFAVRINSDFPSQMTVDVLNSKGIRVNYSLLSIPFYLIEQLDRLLKISQTS